MKYLQEYKKFYAWLDKAENSGLFVLFHLGLLVIFFAVAVFLVIVAPLLLPILLFGVSIGVPVLAYKYRSKE